MGPSEILWAPISLESDMQTECAVAVLLKYPGIKNPSNPTRCDHANYSLRTDRARLSKGLLLTVGQRGFLGVFQFASQPTKPGASASNPSLDIANANRYHLSA